MVLILASLLLLKAKRLLHFCDSVVCLTHLIYVNSIELWFMFKKFITVNQKTDLAERDHQNSEQ